MTLIERIEGAEGPSRGLFGDAYRAIFPSLKSRDHSVEECEKSDLRAFRFWRMLDAEAWLSAAEMLVSAPEWNCELWDSNGIYPEHIRATAWVKGAARCYAATPALALCAAALRAIGDTHDD